MTKICIGCGKILQDVNKDEIGYTPNIKNDYCMRCFRLKNYGELIRFDTINESDVLKKVNNSLGVAFFLIDFLNINIETLNIFKKIKIPKVLVVSKCDTLRKEMKFDKIRLWLKKVYNINEDILFISSKNSFKSSNIFKYMDEHKFNKAFIMGITNAGKSTFINKILKENNINKEILISNKQNTTLDFIKIKIDDYIIYDTPGFIYSNLGIDESLDKDIKLITYNLKGNTTIVINNTWKCFFQDENIVTLYIITGNVKREYHNTCEVNNKINAFNNSDVIIPGIGFLNVKKECQIIANFEELEVRLNISGVEL